MAEGNIQLKNVSSLQSLDLSNGYMCNVETGICGPIDEMNQNETVDEEKKNANNNLV